MKIITEQYYNNLVDAIIKEQEKQAEKLDQAFIGISQSELHNEIQKRIGEAWRLKRDKPVKFSKSDINSVANSRFYRKTGIKLLMILAIVILVNAIAVNNLHFFSVNVGYGIYAVAAILFVFIYSRQQGKVRKQLWREIGREESDEV